MVSKKDFPSSKCFRRRKHKLFKIVFSNVLDQKTAKNCFYHINAQTQSAGFIYTVGLKNIDLLTQTKGSIEIRLKDDFEIFIFFLLNSETQLNNVL
jgi:hypothetical protein